jgi:hypothetical protein
VRFHFTLRGTKHSCQIGAFGETQVSIKPQRLIVAFRHLLNVSANVN